MGRGSPPPSVARRSDGRRPSPNAPVQHVFGRKDHVGRRAHRAFARKQRSLLSGRSSFMGRGSPLPSVARRSDSGRTLPHDRDHRSFARKEHVRRRDKRSFARQEHLGRRGERSFARKARSFHPDAARSSADAALLPASHVVPTVRRPRRTTEIIAPSRGRITRGSVAPFRRRSLTPIAGESARSTLPR